MTEPGTLTERQVADYQRHGFLVLPDLFSRGEVQALLERAREYAVGDRPSPDGIRMQIEPGLAGGARDAGLEQRLRKIEGLVGCDDLFLALARDPRLLDPVASLLGPDIKLFRDALMMKPARHGSEKPYHQDSAYWSIDPPALCSAWIALEDAILENGCMRVIPGSHRAGVMEHRHLRDFQVDDEALDRSGEVAVPLAAGGALLFHSLLLHATSPNTSDRPRRAMICSYMSARSRYTGEEGSAPAYLSLRGASYPGCV